MIKWSPWSTAAPLWVVQDVDGDEPRREEFSEDELKVCHGCSTSKGVLVRLPGRDLDRYPKYICPACRKAGNGCKPYPDRRIS